MTAPNGREGREVPKLFIRYRREDSSGHAGRLYDQLGAQFGETEVSMDLAIAPGTDFVDYIDYAVGSCEVFLAVIGPEWATATDGHGRRRLDNPGDFVRLEVEAALARDDVLLIPTLVRGGRMPTRAELPEVLWPLARRNAIELSDSSWAYDVGRLLEVIETTLRP
jgi:hypothetical protein